MSPKKILLGLIAFSILPLLAEEEITLKVEEKSLVYKESVKIDDKYLEFSLNKLELEDYKSNYLKLKDGRVTFEELEKMSSVLLPLKIFTVELNDKTLFSLGHFFGRRIMPLHSFVGTLFYDKHSNTLYCLIVLSKSGTKDDKWDTHFNLYEIKNFESEIKAYQVGDKIKPDMPMVYSLRRPSSKIYPRMDEGISPYSILLMTDLEKVTMTGDKDNLYIEVFYDSPTDKNSSKYAYNIKSKTWSGDRRPIKRYTTENL